MNKEHGDRSGGTAQKRDWTLAEFTSSINFDRRLFAADIQVNKAYCNALFNAGVLTRLEAQRIKNGLDTIIKRAEFDVRYLKEFPAADIHEFIETRLVQLIGETGYKLQTGKSRIEQHLTAFRFWLRGEIEEIAAAAADLQKALIEVAEKHRSGVLPAFPHLKKGQPILWAHWCLAYFEMISRDLERLDEVWRRVNVLPLGSGESAGTSFEIDRQEIADEIGFEGLSSNSLDAVSDRDFAVEFVAACALIMVHLSRLAADLVLYSTEELRFIEFLDDTASGDPNENQIALELIRTKAGRIFGHQTALLSTLKGLPTAYSQDLQENKEAVFDTFETTMKSLKTASVVIRNVRLNEEHSREASLKCLLNVAELTDYLVHHGVSLPTAQSAVKKISKYADSIGKDFWELGLGELQNFSSGFENDLPEALSLEQILLSKDQIGGTSPERVFEALQAAKEQLER